MAVLMCPGQGSQTPGFLQPWLEDAALKAKLEAYSEAAELDLIKHGTESDAETIRDTAIAQPLIVAASLLSLAALRARASAPHIIGVAGHSVGEFAAAAAAGILSDTEAVALVAIRGRAMAAAAAKVQTGMSAVLGGDQAQVVSALEALHLVPANYNGSGQIVAAGEISRLTELKENPPAGTRVIELAVAGAFHTHFMAEAVGVLRDASAKLSPADPEIRIWTNKDGSEVTSGSAFLQLLVDQVASPVRWDLTQTSIGASGATKVIELSPAGTLVGLARRGLPELTGIALKKPEDLEKTVEVQGEN